jgi:hypothetical protein
MPKEFQDFEGSLPDSEDSFHVAGDGFLRLTNFVVNVSSLRDEHRKIIEKKLLPFLLAATKALGPGEYNLLCLGSASATGTFARNGVLSDERAENSAEYAIALFNQQAPMNPHVSTCVLKPLSKPLADSEAREDVIARHLAPQDIEIKQAAFRAATFILHARRKNPKGSEIFQIRELYLFKFKSKAEPLPAALDRLQKVVASKSILTFFAKRIKLLKPIVESLEKFLSEVTAALGPEGKLAVIMIKFMIPDEMDSCYEIKNSVNNHALFRMNGTGNKFSFGISDLLGLLAEAIAAMKGIVKAVNTVQGLPGSADKAVQFVEKFLPDLHAKAVEFARTFGDGFADAVDAFLTMSENGVTSRAIFAPSSDFVPFVFHDRTGNHFVTEPGGREARRNVFGAGFNEVVDVDFGGAVANNWTDFQASAKIKRKIVDLLEIESVNHGTFFLLKGNYPSDLVVGPTNVVKD